MPVVEELKLQLELAELPELTARLVGLQATLRPVDGLAEVDRVIVPLNPLRLVSVTVEVPDEPAGNETVEGLADIAKSFMVTVTAAE